ncbi:Gfo/Idh/MocA family oxidoreductase [bacterium]|nr:Gfo/Idh/MocA family oxidoreductase [bacterium]
MKEHRVGIIMNGVTGRMGTNQHLIRSICAIRDEGGVHVSPDEVIIPEPILVGRNEAKLQRLSEMTGIKAYSTNLDQCLANERYSIYFDAQTTNLRAEGVRKAIAAGKAIYCEKPTAVDVKTALALYQEATAAGLKNGVVQDKLWLPGLLKLQDLIKTGFFGDILSVRGEFGYWVYEGENEPLQRPSWNYRKDEGGGIIIDMLCHWRYVIDNIFGSIKSISNIGATHIKQRWDEGGQPYPVDTDDSAYTTMELENGIIVQINSSWCVRPRRDDLLVLQVDGTRGSAYAGLRKCYVQPRQATPRELWNPDVDRTKDLYEEWLEVPGTRPFDNAFKVQWELFLRHVVLDEPFRWTLLEGAKGVQLAELALSSWEKRMWVDITDLV